MENKLRIDTSAIAQVERSRTSVNSKEKSNSKKPLIKIRPVKLTSLSQSSSPSTMKNDTIVEELSCMEQTMLGDGDSDGSSHKNLMFSFKAPDVLRHKSDPSSTIKRSSTSCKKDKSGKDFDPYNV